METRAFRFLSRLRQKSFFVENPEDVDVIALLMEAEPNTFFLASKASAMPSSGLVQNFYEIYVNLRPTDDLTRPALPLPCTWSPNAWRWIRPILGLGDNQNLMQMDLSLLEEDDMTLSRWAKQYERPNSWDVFCFSDLGYNLLGRLGKTAVEFWTSRPLLVCEKISNAQFLSFKYVLDDFENFDMSRGDRLCFSTAQARGSSSVELRTNNVLRRKPTLTSLCAGAIGLKLSHPDDVDELPLPRPMKEFLLGRWQFFERGSVCLLHCFKKRRGESLWYFVHPPQEVWILLFVSFFGLPQFSRQDLKNSSLKGRV